MLVLSEVKKMKKISCTCKPKKRGCSHFLSGKCRLTNSLCNCIMRQDSYHYRCCPLFHYLGQYYDLIEYKKRIQKESEKEAEIDISINAIKVHGYIDKNTPLITLERISQVIENLRLQRRSEGK